MKSLKIKLAVSAAAVVMLATPALAARSRQDYAQRSGNYSNEQVQSDVGTYPNGASRTGTAASVDSGAEFNLLRHD